MAPIYIWIISFLAIAGVITRPFKLPEATWAISGAVLLLIFGLIKASEALSGIGKGIDVYLFLTGMMLLAETAREEKLFDWLAAYAVRLAKGSANRLFLLIYLVGIVVTALLSNDATAVVLTPAVAAAAKTARISRPLPYLLICAFIANAASFILPISNPANLVIYGNHMPSLFHWLAQYSLPSFLAITATYFVLRFTQRNKLKEKTALNISLPTLTPGGKTALIGIGVTVLILLFCSALNMQLGLPTAITGILTSAVVTLHTKKNPWIIGKGVSWSVLPLVAGLFVMVEALNKTGMIHVLANILQHSAAQSTTGTALGSGVFIAFASNLLNNLPAGLIAGNVLTGPVPEIIKSAVLIGVDLGPNLSVTGSLATILWLVALRREDLKISGWAFLKIGAFVMTIPLLLALGSLWL